MSIKDRKPFGSLRSLFWPIYPSEYKKFLPMLGMIFLIYFNYNILRAAKDTMVITAPGSGAEAIPFLKVWVMVPMALLMTFIFTRVSNRNTKEKAFYWMIGIFLVYFILFTFFLYPFRDSLHPHNFANLLENSLPQGLKGLVALLRNWTFTSFYVMSELWSAMILTVLFWGFVNDVTSVKEAKRFYAIFGVGANVSGIFAGQIGKALSSAPYLEFLPFGATAWDQSVLYLNVTVIAATGLIIWMFRRLNTKVFRQSLSSYYSGPKVKMSIRKNFSYLMKSRYLLYIALIVVTYNLCINLVEVVWKNQVKLLHPTSSAYNVYMSDVMTLTSFIATSTSLFITGFLLRRFSWTFNALIPPMIMISTGIFFFGFLLFKDSFFGGLAALVGATPLVMTVLFGTLQNSLSRASKYTLFDATKELSFIPLTQESKSKGKAAIDGVGSRIGKSGGSLIHQVLLLAFSTISASTPIIAAIFLAVVGVWTLAVVFLGKQFQALTHQTPDEPLPVPSQPIHLEANESTQEKELKKEEALT